MDAGGVADGQNPVQPAKLERAVVPDAIPAAKVRDALNYHMKPHPIVVLQAAPAPAGWNARFSAIGRSYRYRILNRRASRIAAIRLPGWKANGILPSNSPWSNSGPGVQEPVL